jgi:hypothetical protein
MRQSTCLFFLLLLFFSFSAKGQHQTNLKATVNWTTKSLYVEQEINFNNDSGDTLKTIVLNDWNQLLISRIYQRIQLQLVVNLL